MTINARNVANGVVGHWCFKCGAGIASGEGVGYLGHHWCLKCARSEAKAREALARKASNGTVNGASANNGSGSSNGTANPSSPSPLAAVVRAGLGGISEARIGAMSLTAGVVGAFGGILLLIGLVALCRTASTGLAGPTLTLAGAILLAAVVRR